MFALQSSQPGLLYRISPRCQLQLTGSVCLKQWRGQGAEATSGLSGEECHDWSVMSVGSCQTGVTPIICATVEGICQLRWMGWEGNQTWFWNRYIYLCKWTNWFSDNQSISVSFTWGCSFGWPEKMEGLNQQSQRCLKSWHLMLLPENALLEGSDHSSSLDLLCIYYEVFTRLLS